MMSVWLHLSLNGIGNSCKNSLTGYSAHLYRSSERKILLPLVAVAVFEDEISNRMPEEEEGQCPP